LRAAALIGIRTGLRILENLAPRRCALCDFLRVSLYDGFLANLLFAIALAAILASDRKVDAARRDAHERRHGGRRARAGAVGDPPQAPDARSGRALRVHNRSSPQCAHHGRARCSPSSTC
jgi:hypothetical protein